MSFFKKVGDSFQQKVGDVFDSTFGTQEEKHSHSHLGNECDHLHPDEHTENRFHSFAPETNGRAKWYVDGCTYFWAVSEAIEQARESIYILDWWLSPEVYLRRPPSGNQRYRLDNMLRAAAERGVQVYIIVYREVEAALTLNSSHTRQALEKIHPNIKVFRHPDHTPAGYDLTSELGKSFKSLTTFDLAKASGDAVKAIYGTTSGGVVLFWAHHEKLLVVDRKVGFMGGLDLCFGRWDTSSHPIADAHPGNLDAIVFPGQDYNNARVYDFAEVNNWNQNKLDRTKSSRMGWSDVALSMDGPIVSSLVDHFVDRWNFIHKEKYAKKNPGKYPPLSPPRSLKREEGSASILHSRHAAEEYMGDLADRFNRGLNMVMHGEDDPRYARRDEDRKPHIQLTRSCCPWSSGHKTEHSIANAYVHAISTAKHCVYIENQFFITATDEKQRPVQNKIGAVIVERILRAFRNDEDFKIWIVMPAVPAFAGDLQADDALGTRAIMEFQYFSINRGGYSIIEKLRQAGMQDTSRYIGFYNLRNYDRINTSATMAAVEARTGLSYEEARKQHDQYVGAGGYPGDQRSYGQTDQRRYGRSDQYESRRDDRYDSRRDERYDSRGDDRYDSRRDDRYDSRRDDQYGYGRNDQYGSRRDDRYESRRGDPYESRRDDQSGYGRTDQYERYQQEARKVEDKTLDTVSACYMDGGPSIVDIPWDGNPEDEINAFVTEELYVHSKLLIADDRLVICGSANLNDRSQLGSHDSEIAVVIEDPTPVESMMNGRPYTASKFAASLRRYIFRKHLGLIPDQRWDQPDQNWQPVDRSPNSYDWGSPADMLVRDPMHPNFHHLWDNTARINTETFSRAFHPVPNDHVRTWEDYKTFYSRHFTVPGKKETDEEKQGKVEYGHIIREEFPGGVQEVKQWLSRIRGTLVEMPLNFLIDVDDIAKEGVALNAMTFELYT